MNYSTTLRNNLRTHDYPCSWVIRAPQVARVARGGGVSGGQRGPGVGPAGYQNGQVTRRSGLVQLR
jgi:hypothetical protein